MKKQNSKTWCNVGIAAGLIAIFFALYLFVGDSNFITPDYAKFGADYYTEQYAATRDAAINIARLGDIVKNAAASLLLSLGVADIAYFFNKKTQMDNSEKLVDLLEKMQPSDIKEKEETADALKF